VVARGDAEPLHIRAFIVELVDRTSAGNAHTNYRALRTFFNWLVLEEEIDRTPMDRTKPPIVPEKPVPVVTDSGIKTLFTSCQGKDFISLRDTAIIRVLFDTGARPSEIANLSVDDIDFDLRLIHVFGKGRRSRTIPFSPKTGLALLRYLRARAQHRDADSPKLWLGLRGLLTGEGIKQMLKRRGDAAACAGCTRTGSATPWRMCGSSTTATRPTSCGSWAGSHVRCWTATTPAPPTIAHAASVCAR
jgi:site-specific recombinase XerD